MATPRRLLIDQENPLFYHLVSRCVRKSWLCGVDRTTRRNYSHRKSWLVERLKQLGQAFAIDIYAYAIMSNHFHLVVYLDPKAPERWTDLEVANRWLQVCPPRLPSGSIDEGMQELQRDALLSDIGRLNTARSNLASLSVFMKLLKQPIARRANLEDKCSGHFFEQRFYSGALLSEDAVLAAMAYVDLNPIRAKIVETVKNAIHTSVHARLMESKPGIREYLKPIIAGVNAPVPFTLELNEYVNQLEILVPSKVHRPTNSKDKRWHDQVYNLKRRQRAFGPDSLLSEWISRRGWQLREIALPS